MKMIEFKVNGTLMRGLELNANLQKVGAIFVREDITSPIYRLWLIADRHPAMLRVSKNGQAIASSMSSYCSVFPLNFALRTIVVNLALM